MSGEIILMSGIFTEILGSKGIIKVKNSRMIEKRKERNPNNPNNFIGPAWEYADVEDDAYTDGVTDFAIKTLGDFKDSRNLSFLQ